MIKGALKAWTLAIESFLAQGQSFPAKESIADRAAQYGRNATDKASLELVSKWFDWDEVTEYLRERDSVA